MCYRRYLPQNTPFNVNIHTAYQKGRVAAQTQWLKGSMSEKMVELEFNHHTVDTPHTKKAGWLLRYND